MEEGQPSHIGRYKIVGELGRGGFGRVYRGYDPTVGRPVAVKILTQISEDSLTRFRNEAVVAGNLGHRNIVTVYEYGTHDGSPFLAMEYLEGQDLYQIMASGSRLSLLKKCNIMWEVAEGLHCAHQSGVVHRDMKPGNIMVLKDGSVKIMDFGIARLTSARDATRLTQRGYVIGTLRYMAPEQLAGSDFDALCDIFAYGVVFYELLTGRHPFEAPDAHGLMYKLTFEDPVAIRTYEPDVPEALQDVISRIIHKDRARRYQSLREVQFDTEPIRIDLQRGYVAALLKEVQNLIGRNEFERAQDLVHEALALDSSNRAARALREELKRQLQQQASQQRTEISLRLGEEHLGERRFTEAVRAFEQALMVDPGNNAIQARVEHARGMAEDSRRAAQLLAEARKELEERNITAAYRSVSLALRHDPKNPEAVEFLKTIQAYVESRQAEQRVDDTIRKAQGLMLIPDYDGAIAALTSEGRDAESPRILDFLQRVSAEKAAHERKQKIRIEMAKATELLRDHRLEDAAQCLENLQRDHPDEPDVGQLLAYVQREQAALTRSRFVESTSNEARARAEIQDFDGALAVLDRALQQHPGESILIGLLSRTLAAKDAWNRRQATRKVCDRAETLLRQRQPEAAARALEQALAVHSEDRTLSELLQRAQDAIRDQKRARAVEAIGSEAARRAEANEFDEALRLVDNGLASWPSDPELARRRSAILEAKLAWERKAQRDASIERLGREAGARADAGDLDGAAALLDGGLQTWPDASSLREIRGTIGIRIEERRKRDRALKDLEEVRIGSLRASNSAETARLLSVAVSIASQHAGDDAIQTAAAGPIALLSDIGNVRNLLAERNFRAALDICGGYLARFPEHAAFGELKAEAERAQRRANVSEYHERATAEPDLEIRTAILLEARKRHPEEPVIEDELRLTGNRLALVDSIVKRAHAYEKSGRWMEALEQWRSLLTIYDRYKGLSEHIERVKETAITHAVDRYVELVHNALQAWDLSRAADLLRQAQAEYPQAGRLQELAIQLQSIKDKRGVAREPLPPGQPGELTHAVDDADAGPAAMTNPVPASIVSPDPEVQKPRWKASLLLAGVGAALAGGLFIAGARLSRREVAVQITSNVSGASISVGSSTCVTPSCVLDLAPGRYTLHASAIGHQVATREFTVQSGGSPTNVQVMMEPLPQVLQVNTNFEDGQVYLDGHLEGALTDDRFTLSGVSLGRHIIRVTGQNVSFEGEWKLSAGVAPELLRLSPGKDVEAMIVASDGAIGSLVCNCVNQPVAVDGVPVTTTPGAAGVPVELHDLKQGTRQIALGKRSVVVDIGPNPALNVVLALDRDQGLLVVKVGEDGSRIFLNNHLYRHATDHGMLRIPVKTGKYSVRVEKEGFVSPEAQTLIVNKGEEKLAAFTLTPARSYLEIVGSAVGMQIMLDGQTIGQTDQNGAFRHAVEPGKHTVELTKKDYVPIRRAEQFLPGRVLRLGSIELATVQTTKTVPLPDAIQIEAQDWAQIANSGSPDDFEAFIRNHPGGPHVQQARNRAAELRQSSQLAAARLTEQSAWSKVNQNSRDELKGHLSRFPEGLHAQEAREKIAELDRQAEEALAAQPRSDERDAQRAKGAADEQAVVNTLKEFESAYNRKDLPALQVLWAETPAEAYRRQFREAASLKFQLQVIGRPTLAGDSAMATCIRTLTYQGQSGGAQTHSERVAVTLRREASGWRIRSMKAN